MQQNELDPSNQPNSTDSSSLAEGSASDLADKADKYDRLRDDDRTRCFDDDRFRREKPESNR